MNADIAVFVNLDVVYQVREDFTGERFNALLGGLPFIIGFHIPVFLLGDFHVFPILIQ